MAAFREQEKPSVVWCQSIESIPHYLLATAFETVAVQPTGGVAVGGLCATQLFFRGLLDKAGIAAQVFHCGEYKSAGEIFTERQHTPASREALEGVVGSLFESMLEAAAASRGMHTPWMEAAVGESPYEAEDAVEAHLIDVACHRGEARLELHRLHAQAQGGQALPLPLTLTLIEGPGRPGPAPGSHSPLSLPPGGPRATSPALHRGRRAAPLHRGGRAFPPGGPRA